MIIFYLCGPMTGYPEHNYPAFHAAEKALELWSDPTEVVIINPANNFNGERNRPREDYMKVDIEHVLRADKLVLLPGWEDSLGARLEVAVAMQTGKNFITAYNDDGRWDFEDHGPGWIPVAPANEASPRAALLSEATELVTGDRNNSYGPPTQDFQRSSEALNAYGYRGPDGRLLQAHDIAIMVMSVKLSRLMWTPQKRDSWVDVAGYAACGYECAVEEAA